MGGPGLLLVYLMAADPSMRGCLYRVVQPSELEVGADPDVLVAQEVMLDSSRQARKSVVPVFTVANSDPHWRPDQAQLCGRWTITSRRCLRVRARASTASTTALRTPRFRGEG